MIPPLLLDVFAPPVTYGATAGIYTAARLPTLEESRAGRLPIPQQCTCGPLECDYHFRRADEAYSRAMDE